jgi:2-C-methyl-D-erythritol 4-phosphate cytidylyltransferase
LSVLALVSAAGDGGRLGTGLPQALVCLGGVPMVVRAVRGLLESGVVDHVQVAVRDADLDKISALFAAAEAVDVAVCGPDRACSVGAALRDGLRRCPGADIVLVHDAARALTPATLVRSLVAAVSEGMDAVLPVLPVADTVKAIDADGAVEHTLDRSTLRAVQTPWAFRRSVLEGAYAADPAAADAGLVERLGVPVHTVPGDPLAFKVTTRWDLRLAELLAGS